MGKSQKNNFIKQQKTVDDSNTSCVKKTKRTRRAAQREFPPQRSSVYRGVTRHRWTGRYEAHLWDKNCWNESQNKKGKQVYLGAYDDEAAAAHAYDLAALKYWGHDTILNFPLSTYQEDLQEMENQSREEYIGYIRRKSSGFSRGVSKYRGVARHHHNGRWEARIGRVFGNKYLYLGTYATQEEAATAYDIAAIEYRGLNAVTNFDLSRYIKWIRPKCEGISADQTSSSTLASIQNAQQNEQMVAGKAMTPFSEPRQQSSALGLLLQSSKFKEMLEISAAESGSPSSFGTNDDEKPIKCSFPDYIQTYFECQESVRLNEEEDSIFGGLNTFASPLLDLEI